MLVTTCRHCGARFRVMPEQLNQKQGQVRCGECQRVFNGFESLKGYRVDDQGLHQAYPQPEPEPPPHPDSGESAAIPTPALEAIPAAEPEELPEPEAVPEPEPVPASTAQPFAEAPQARGDEPEAPLSVADEGMPAAPPPQSRLRPASRDYEHYLPESPPRPARAWAFGVVLLALTLGLQVAFAYRAEIARQYPQMRPALEAVCVQAGCTVAWVNDESALRLEESDLIEVPGKAGQISLQARIRNLSTSAQQHPHIELTLSDSSGQVAIRRVLRPAEYLGHAPAPGDVMAPGSEVQLSIRFDTGNSKPTGYELLLFYP